MKDVSLTEEEQREKDRIAALVKEFQESKGVVISVPLSCPNLKPRILRDDLQSYFGTFDDFEANMNGVIGAKVGEDKNILIQEKQIELLKEISQRKNDYDIVIRQPIAASCMKFETV